MLLCLSTPMILGMGERIYNGKAPVCCVGGRSPTVGGDARCACRYWYAPGFIYPGHRFSGGGVAVAEGLWETLGLWGSEAEMVVGKGRSALPYRLRQAEVAACSLRPAMKSPVYKAAPHEWG